MKKLDEQSALAIVFANTKKKTRRPKDLISIAEAFEYLVALYGSQKTLGEKVGLSSEMIREFRKILTLPKEIRDMIQSREIDSQDVAYKISTISNPREQVEVAREVISLPTRDVRDIKRLVTSAGLSARESKKKVLESKLRELHVFAIDFDDYEYTAIIKKARAKKKYPSELIKQVILDWLGKNEESTGMQQKNRMK